MNKFWQLYAWGTIIIAFFMLILVSFWCFYPYKTLVFNDAKFPILTPKVKQGGLLQYTSDYCKYTDQTATVSRAFVNGIIFTTPLMNSNREIGCHKIVVGVSVPAELPVGRYELVNTYKYQVNPIREIVITEKSEFFEVIE